MFQTKFEMQRRELSIDLLDIIVPNQENSDSESETPFQIPSSIEKTLMYPFDIRNIHEKQVTSAGPFGSYPESCYDVTCFNSVKYTCGNVCKEIATLYPGFQFKIYAYRAKKKTSGTVIGKMRFLLKPDHKKKFVHVNVELLE